MIDQEREGSADIECTILPDGHTNNCQLVGTKGGDAFGRAAMAYVISKSTTGCISSSVLASELAVVARAVSA
jgi:hypothetical protein